MYFYLLCFVFFVLCFLYCFVYVCLFLFVLSVIVYGILPPSDNSIAVCNNNNNNDDVSALPVCHHRGVLMVTQAVPSNSSIV